MPVLPVMACEQRPLRSVKRSLRAPAQLLPAPARRDRPAVNGHFDRRRWARSWNGAEVDSLDERRELCCSCSCEQAFAHTICETGGHVQKVPPLQLKEPVPKRGAVL